MLDDFVGASVRRERPAQSRSAVWACTGGRRRRLSEGVPRGALGSTLFFWPTVEVEGSSRFQRLVLLAVVVGGCGPQVDLGSESAGGESDTGALEDGSASIAGPNLPPVAVDDIVYGTQDVALVLGAAEGVLANDGDPNDDQLTVIGFEMVSARGGEVRVDSDGAVTYEPPPGTWGTDRFGYEIEDGDGETSTATVLVHVAPILIPLAEVAEGVGGFVLEAEANTDSAGAVSGAGDVNGDGLPDVLVGAKGATPNGEGSGRSFVVFGKADGEAVRLSDVVAGAGGFAMDGEAQGDISGFAVSGAGDVNGDGLLDVIVGAVGAGAQGELSGRSYVVFGKEDSSIVQLTSVAQGEGGFVLDGEAEGDQSGSSVSGAGDVNGDGLADVIIGAPFAEPKGYCSGRTYVAFGKVDTAPVQLSDLSRGEGGFVLDGAAEEDCSGVAVSGAGDVNGDGLDDLIVGAHLADPNGDKSGRTYVVFGKADTGLVELNDIAGGVGGFALDGEAEVDISGARVSDAGDVNGDGLDDVIIGAHFADPNGSKSGRSYLVFGKADTERVQLRAIAAGVGGFALDGEAENDFAGAAVGRAGDVNGDGLDDLIIGASYADPTDNGSGRTYVVFGKLDTERVQLGALSGHDGFMLDGEAGLAHSGLTVSGAGDVNGDGLDDVIMSSIQTFREEGTSPDRSYVVFGVPTG